MITASLTIQWGIAGPAPAASVSGQRTVEWSILDRDPVPVTAITGSRTVQWIIWSADAITLELLEAPTGLAGVLTITVQDVAGNNVYGPTVGGITEEPAGSGRYVATVPNFAVGTYFAIWSDGLSQAIAELTIISSGFLETFTRIGPPARADSVPWTSVVILEGATRRGPFLEIDTATLSPVDTDPTNPVSRTITTGQAALPAGWYALVWNDADGHQQMTDPEYASHVIVETA